MSFKKRFGIDGESKNNGVWFTLGNGIDFKIKYRKNKETTNAMFDYLRNQKVLNIADLKDEALEGLMPELIKTLVVDWKGVKDDEGKDIDFSKENLINLLFEKDESGEYIFINTLEWIQRCSENSDKFSIGYAEKKLKN